MDYLQELCVSVVRPADRSIDHWCVYRANVVFSVFTGSGSVLNMCRSRFTVYEGHNWTEGDAGRRTEPTKAKNENQDSSSFSRFLVLIRKRIYRSIFCSRRWAVDWFLNMNDTSTKEKQAVFSFFQLEEKNENQDFRSFFRFLVLTHKTDLPFNISFPLVGGSSYWHVCFFALYSSK